MPLLDDINRVLRDFERYTGDGKPGAPTAAPLPTGDPSSGVYNLRKHDLRELLKAIAQSMGDPSALQDLLTEIRTGRVYGPVEATPSGLTPPEGTDRIITAWQGGIQYWAQTGAPANGLETDDLRRSANNLWWLRVYDSRDALADLHNQRVAGPYQATPSGLSLPTNTSRVLTASGGGIQYWAQTSAPQDGLETDRLKRSAGGQWWLRVYDSRDLRRAARVYQSRADAEIEISAAPVPSDVEVIFTIEDRMLVLRGRAASAVDPLFPTGPRWGIIGRYGPAWTADEQAQTQAAILRMETLKAEVQTAASGEVGTPTFATRAEAEAAVIPSAALNLIANGLVYSRDDEGTALLTSGGRKWSPAGEPDARHFGARGDGVWDDRDALDRLLTFGALTGRKVTIPAGTYLVSDTVSWPMVKDLHVALAPGARIVAASTMPVDHRLLQPTSAGTPAKLIWEGGVLDGRAMPARASGAPDLLYAAGPFSVHVKGATFISNDTRAGTAGDSLIFLAEGEDYWIEGCHFTGAVDSAIYISGDNTGMKGRRARVTGNTFSQCNGCVIFKRQFEDIQVSGNTFVSCTNGVTVGGEVDSVSGLLTASRGVISGNIFRDTVRPIEARIADGTIITGNRIEDHGGALSEAGIVIAGSNGCIVTDNWIKRTKAGANATLFGIRLMPRTWEGVTYNTTGTLMAGNVISGVSHGIHEIAGVESSYIAESNRVQSSTAAFTLRPSSIRGGARGYTAGSGTIAGYVTMTDNDGVSRKLAVLA